MAAPSTAPDLNALRAELDHVRWMVADWKQRKSPIVEKAVLQTRLAAAEAAVANAISPSASPAGDPAEIAKHQANIATHAAKIAMTSTAKAAHSMLDHETNARFWAQTGYKPGGKLDMSIPADRAMAKVWSDIYAKVKDEDDHGRLVLTYNHPAVEQHLENAATAHHDAAASLELASAAQDPDLVAKHEQDAANAHAASQSAAAQAAAMQPATVSPDVAHHAATEAAHMTDMPLPPPPQELPAKHPAHSNVNARPHHTIQITAPHPVWDVPRGTVRPPASPSEFYATWQTSQTPAKADEVHAIAAAVPAPKSTIDGGTIADIRAHGHELALADGHQFTATALMPDNSWQTSSMPSREALDGWYGEITDHPDSFKYAAIWDKTDEHNFLADGSPSNETFGSGKAIDVRVAVERPPAITKRETTTSYGPAIALGATALAAGAAIFAGRKHGKRRAS